MREGFGAGHKWVNNVGYTGVSSDFMAIPRVVLSLMWIQEQLELVNNMMCHKRVIVNLRNLRKQIGTSNDGFQIAQRKGVRDPLVSKHETGYNEKPMDDLVDGSRKKVGAPPRKTGIFLGKGFPR
ncbi:hypothetical protein Tco_0778113, partial [Tanacetum coccineum]